MFAPTPPKPASAPPALGSHLQRRHQLRPGLSLHADDTVDPVDFTAQGPMDSGLRIVVLLEGAVDVSYGDRRLMMRSGSPRGPCAVMVNLAEPEPFVRRLRKGRHARRVSVSLGPDWLAQMAVSAPEQDAVADFTRRHLAVHAFAPSARLLALAGQLATVPDATPMLRHLYMESRVLEFAAEALSELLPAQARAATWPQTLRPRDARRMQQLHAFLASDEALGLSLQAIAQHMGMHPNTMQRHFRAQYGSTVVEHLRESRLQRARLALEREGITVAQAAELAGYSSPANFATAFRRRFGMPPKWVRVHW